MGRKKRGETVCWYACDLYGSGFSVRCERKPGVTVHSMDMMPGNQGPSVDMVILTWPPLSRSVILLEAKKSVDFRREKHVKKICKQMEGTMRSMECMLPACERIHMVILTRAKAADRIPAGLYAYAFRKKLLQCGLPFRVDPDNVHLLLLGGGKSRRTVLLETVTLDIIDIEAHHGGSAA